MPEGDHRDPPTPFAPPEALLVCPECGAPLPAPSYETHLRQAHRLFYFRGARRPYNDAVAHLLGLVVGAPPDAEAWPALSRLVRQEQGVHAPAALAALLGASLARIDDARRDEAAGRLADLMGSEGDAPLTAALSEADDPAARLLALNLLARQAPPFNSAMLRPLRQLLLDRRLPALAQFAALSARMRAGGDGAATTRLLRRLIAGLGRGRAVKRLKEFERFHGKAPAVAALRREIEARMPLRCPRCPARLARPAMLRHVWDEHRLVLDGRRVRDPWSVIEDWVAESRRSGDAALLERCRIRARQLDPDDGARRVERLVLRAGAADADAWRDLLAAALERHASLCPWCYALCPLPREAPTPPVNLRPGRLSAGEYAVETSAAGVWTRLEVRAPGRVVFQGREGRRYLTRRGATLLLAGPFVLLALACAAAGAGAAVVLSASAAALLALWMVRAFWPAAGPPSERLVRHAWALLAPDLHQPDYRAEDAAFLTGLASVTPPGALRAEDAPLLASLVKRTQEAVAAGTGAPGHLAALHRLLIEDAAARGADPVALVADRLAPCFDGRQSLAYAERLLSGWGGWWTRGGKARLRALLCDRAFEAGFEVGNLLDAGRTAPALGVVLGVGDAHGLAALRLLWSQRPTRPWDPCGEARTIFDLAAEPDHDDLLDRHPDLLLWQREPAWVVALVGGEEPMREAEIVLGAGGLWLQEARFTAAPAVVEESYGTFGGDLLLGGKHFRGSGEVDALARRMERWFRFAFRDFLPQVPGVRAWRSPERAAILRAWGAAPCPECGRYLLARAGAVGVALDEAAQAGEALSDQTPRRSTP